MLSVIRKTIPFHRARRHRPPFPHGSLSGHLLRDLGFESHQVEEILTFVAGTSTTGRRSHGTDAELSYCVRAPANSNELDPDDEPAHPVWRPGRMQEIAAT